MTARTALRFAVIGDPIGHSLSPIMHGAALAALGLPHTYEAIRVPVEALAATVDLLRRGELHGMNVTVPHKVAAMALCDALTDEAKVTGATNTLWLDEAARVVGTNTDVDGLRADLVAHGVAPRAALVLGAGGAARAAILAIAAAAPGAIVRIAARRDEAAAWLAAELGCAEATSWRSIAGADRGFDLIVNATSAGMSGKDDGAPIADALARAPKAPGAVAYDLVYRPPPGLDATAFLLRARALGLRPIDGLGMLVEQGVRALSIFLHRPLGEPVRRAMLAAVHDALAAGR